MTKHHMKRVAAPKSWNILRKSGIFITRPKSGAHTLARAMPVGVWLKEIFGIAKTERDVRNILLHDKF